MGQNPEQNPNYYEGYRGGYSSPAPSGSYGSAEEQPKSSYEYPGDQQNQGQQSSSGNPEQQYYQQQYEQQQQQQYNQQQQQQYNQNYQPPFSSTYYGDANTMGTSSLGIPVRLTALLSYLFSWVGGLVVLLTEKQNQFLRFHAMQSIILAVTFWIIQWVASILPFVGGRLGWGIWVVGTIIWIVTMVKAYQGQYFKLPIIGEYAERFSRQIKI